MTEVTRPGICASLKKGRCPEGARCLLSRDQYPFTHSACETTGFCLRLLPAPQPFPDRRTSDVWPMSGSDLTEVSCPQGGSIFPPNTYSRSSSSSMAGSCIRSPLSGKAPRE